MLILAGCPGQATEFPNDFNRRTKNQPSKPKDAKLKSLPIVLLVHGAGVRSAQLNSAAYWCKNGVLAMDINAHGIPNGEPPEFYKELEQGSLKGYPAVGRESRETCYFLGMFLRELRAIDFLCAQPEWAGKNVVVYGASQGGFLLTT